MGRKARSTLALAAPSNEEGDHEADGMEVRPAVRCGGARLRLWKHYRECPLDQHHSTADFNPSWTGRRLGALDVQAALLLVGQPWDLPMRLGRACHGNARQRPANWRGRVQLPSGGEQCAIRPPSL